MLRTLMHVANGDNGRLISIIVLEFVIVIISYCADLTVFTTYCLTEDPHPILLNVVDNMSAHSWTTHTYKSSRNSKLNAKFSCYLQMNSPTDINSTWVSTLDDAIAGEISRLKGLISS